ncbi:MAG: aspartate/glutamate racemase family protein [Candidatus Pacebacteria bacterium]|nr:aspartate/glutamate racemase family protein [Candidatus Paceibacterota bacterium]
MIGIFDSGIGGLSVLKAIKEKAPNLDIVYFGDIKNAPYGIRSQEELRILTQKNVERLVKEGATNIVSACNSVSIFFVIEEMKTPISKEINAIEMVGPTVRAISSLGNKKIAILATPATIESGIYERAFERAGNKNVKGYGIPELAGGVEFGYKREEIKKIISWAVKPVLSDQPEIIALCCTHYLFVVDIFKEVLREVGNNALVFNPASAVADEVAKQYGEKGEGKLKFIISKDSKVFRSMAKDLFKKYPYTIEVEEN